MLAKTLRYAVTVLGVLATLAGAATMTYTREQQTVPSSPTGDQAVRKDYVMAQRTDGQEVPVMVLNAKVGDRLDCSVIDGKIACK